MAKRGFTQRSDDSPSPLARAPSLEVFAFKAGSGNLSPWKRAKTEDGDRQESSPEGIAVLPDGMRRSPRIKKPTSRTTLVTVNSSKTGKKSSSSSKTKNAPKGYAPPEKYAHLRELQDVIDYHLDVLFCGINPGKKSAEIGHHFGHPTNQFWYCLHQAGFTSQQLSPTEEFELPGQFQLGITDLVDRPTSEESELSVQDKIDGIPTLLAKVSKYQPRILCFVSLDNARIVQRQMNQYHKQKGIKAAKSGLGVQAYKMIHQPLDGAPGGITETLFYAVPSTSGLVRVPQREGKVEIFKALHQTLEQQKAGTLDTRHLWAISPF